MHTDWDHKGRAGGNQFFETAFPWPTPEYASSGPNMPPTIGLPMMAQVLQGIQAQSRSMCGV